MQNFDGWLAALDAFVGQAKPLVIFPQAGKQVLSHPFPLETQGHDKIRPVQRRIQIGMLYQLAGQVGRIDGRSPKPLNKSGWQQRGGTG